MMYLRATDEVYDKFWAYVLAVPGEIGGFGFATIENQRLIWKDIFLVDQFADTGGVDFTDKGIIQAIERAGASDWFYEDPNAMWVWWHSHGGLGVFWSSTDEEGVKALKASGIPYMISVVGNHKMESKVRIDVFNVPIIGHAERHDVELRRTEGVFPDLQQEVNEFVHKKVAKKPAPKARASTTTSHGEQRQLPPGTRETDPGAKVDKALVQAALDGGYSEYTQDELEGKKFGSDIDTDDNGVQFDWQDVSDWLGDDDDEAAEWTRCGCDVVTVNGQHFLLDWHAETLDTNPDYDAMDKLEQRESGDPRPPIYEAHAS